MDRTSQPQPETRNPEINSVDPTLNLRDLEEAKRLICEKILRHDPNKEWPLAGEEYLQQLCTQGLPISQIERIGWLYSFPDDENIPELKQRLRLRVSGLLMITWQQQLDLANAYWKKLNSG